MALQHVQLAAGKWFRFSLAEQLGNIGSEVHRVTTWRGKDEAIARGAFTRALELTDLTLRDPRHRNRLKEIARLRELLCDAAADSHSYRTTIDDIDHYLTQFAVLARNPVVR